MYTIKARGFPGVVFVALSASKCISTLGPSSSIHNSFPILFIHSAFCYDFSIPIFCSKIFLPRSHPVAGMTSPILPLRVGRIFFRCFGKSCFVCIVWSCLGIFLFFLLSTVFLISVFELYFSF